MKDKISELNSQLETERVVFNIARMRLAAIIGVSWPRPGAEDILISKAYEFGVSHALQSANRHPDYFELGSAPHQGTIEKFTEPLTNVVASCHRLDEIVRRREDLLRKAEPNRKRVFIWLGREFTVDGTQKTIRYLDTGCVEPFRHTYEPPRTSPTTSRGRSR